MFLKKMALLPTFLFGFFAISALIGGNLFLFFVWLFAALLLFVSFFPFVIEMEEKKTPVFHVFASMFLFIFFLSSIAILDFQKAGFSLVQAVFFGLSIGILLVAVLMILRGSE